MLDIILNLLNFENPFFVLAAGLLLGLIHSFEPDHVGAMSTQLLRKSESDIHSIKLKKITLNSSIKGIFWGLGHTSSIILLGIAITGLSINMTVDFFSGAEVIVGFMLIGLAMLTILNKRLFSQQHIHPHSHGDKIHTHPHSHTGSHEHTHKSLLIGCIHGIAGSGSIVVLAASSSNNFESSVMFLVIFGIGSILGMGAISGLLGMQFALLSKIGKFNLYFRYLVSATTLAIGINIVYEIFSDSGSLLPF